jgi:hypothetical protein
MKKGKFLFLSPILVGILLIPAYSQEDMEVVKNDGFAIRQRPPVVFRHDEHNETAKIEDCNECHHVYENGKKLEDESSEDQSCSDCHDEKDSGNRHGLKKAFHSKCKACHIEQKKGPIMCGTCHVRRIK